MKDTEAPILPGTRPTTDVPLEGKYVTLEPLTPQHMPDLWSNLGFSHDQSILDWLPWSKPSNSEEMWDLFDKLQKDRGFAMFAIVGDPECVNPPLNRPVSGTSHRQALGTIGYLAIKPEHRTIETGAVLFGSSLKRTTAATEAHLLLLRNVFESKDALPYRRVAWKNNTLNTASRRAAERLGYVFEGQWRNHMLQNGKSRSSDWLSIPDDEWPLIKRGLEMWLSESNFGPDGEQKRTLEDFRAHASTYPG